MTNYESLLRRKPVIINYKSLLRRKPADDQLQEPTMEEANR